MSEIIIKEDCVCVEAKWKFKNKEELWEAVENARALLDLMERECEQDAQTVTA